MIRREFLKQLCRVGLGGLALSRYPFCSKSEKNIDEQVLSFNAQYPGTDWTMGIVDPEISGSFKIMSWESEFQFRKWNKIIRDFFQTYYPKLEVELDWGIDFGNYNTKLPVLLAGGAPPDLIWIHDTRVKSFASLDLLQPLDPFFKHFTPPGWPEDYYSSQVNSFKYKDIQYGFPYDFATGGLYINMDMYNEIDEELPNENWTFDQLLKVGKQLTKGKSQYGLNLGRASNAAYQYWILRSFGGDWFNDDFTESKFNMPETIEAYQWITDLRWIHKVAPLPGVTQGRPQPFVDGVVAIDFGLGAPAFADLLEGKSFNWTVAPTPKGREGRFQFVGGSALAIPQAAKHKYIAYELIRYMLSKPENLEIIGKMGRMFVSRKSMYEYGLPTGDLRKRMENYKHVFYDLARKDGVVVPYIHKYQEWESMYRRNMELLYYGEELDAKKVCLKLHEETSRFLDELNEERMNIS